MEAVQDNIIPVNGSDPSAGQHGGCQERRGWHIDGHPVAFLHSLSLQHIGNTTRALQQLAAIWDRIQSAP